MHALPKLGHALHVFPAPQTLANELWARRSGCYAIRGHTLRKLDMGMPAFISAPVTRVSPEGILSSTGSWIVRTDVSMYFGIPKEPITECIGSNRAPKRSLRSSHPTPISTFTIYSQANSRTAVLCCSRAASIFMTHSRLRVSLISPPIKAERARALGWN
jgi:hypothetical protein